MPSASVWDLYKLVLDVRGFPNWAPGVKRVEVVEYPPEGSAGPGMISEWEVSFFGVSRRVSSVLVEAEAPGYLRWSYDGPIRGWGECHVRERAGGVLAEFRTELNPTEPLLEKLMRTSIARSAATRHLKRCLSRLGGIVSDGGRPRVGPLATPSRGG